MENQNLDPIRIQRWPTETLFTWLVGFFAASIWLLLAFTIIGFFYALLIFVAIYLGHIGFIAHIRGSAVKLSPEQFPEIHQAVVNLANRVGFEKIPDAYIMQQGGALNAFATKFFKSNMLVLYSDLLEACGSNTDARDMIIAHELGHLKEGHLKWHWFLLPGMIYPFIGHALSRAREYTCDRYGYAAVKNKEAGLRGLAILAAGAQRGPQVNLRAMAHQAKDLNTGWLTIGQWLGTHPPLAKRLIALENNLAPEGSYTQDGILKALGIIGLVYVLPIFMIVMGIIGFSIFNLKNLNTKLKTGKVEKTIGAAEKKIENEILSLAKVAEEAFDTQDSFPKDTEELYSLWKKNHPAESEPTDPYTQERYLYVYEKDKNRYEVWTNGPDQKKLTDDDSYITDSSYPTVHHGK